MPPSSPFRVVDLFAGCGGLSQGFHQSGYFKPVAAVEWDRFAAATYAANFGEDHIYHGDIAAWVEGDLPEADVVVGGPPCQGFSNLGKRDEDDQRNDLWQRYVDALVRIRPKAFLMENVDRFLKSKQFKAFEQLFEDGGVLANYAIDVKVLRATDYGAAQLRKRAIVIGTRRDLTQIMIPPPAVAESDWRSVEDAFRGLSQSIPTDRTELPEGRVSTFGGMPGPFKSSDLHITRNYDEHISLPRFAAIPKGGNRFDLPDELKSPCWLKHTTGSGDVMGRMHWNRPSVTIRTEFFKPEKGRYLHPEEPRAISHHEAARLQGFPDDFLWCGSKVEIARQIGNAVPVELAHALAKHIGEELRKQDAKPKKVQATLRSVPLEEQAPTAKAARRVPQHA